MVKVLSECISAASVRASGSCPSLVKGVKGLSTGTVHATNHGTNLEIHRYAQLFATTLP